jgi:hypothetical protein
MNIAKHVNVNTKYTRSINLERDSSSDANIWPYTPTSRALQTIGRIVETINDKEAPRAWALIGPYGSGKSAFGLYLTQLLSRPGSAGAKNALDVLKRADEKLSKHTSNLMENSTGYCCISLTGSPESLSNRLIKAMIFGVEAFYNNKRGPTPKIIKQLHAYSDVESIKSSDIVNLITGIQKSVFQSGGAGILIVIDELGKFLEFEARHRNANDIFLLQTIAELAYKPNQIPLHFVVMLHQAFEQYFHGLGDQLKNEWKKVQGRFENVSFLESTEQILQILGSTLISDFDEEITSKISSQCDRLTKSLSAANALPQGMNEEIAVDIFEKCYPIHPLSLLLLPNLCQKVAQNERTLFTYLGSNEPHGFLNSLSKLEILDENLPWVFPCEIYDYFILSQPGLTIDQTTHRRWAEITTALDRLGDAPITEIQLLKTIGLLNIVGMQSGFKASKDIIKLCYDGKENKFNKALKSLENKSIITFRKYSGEYRVWQGSDFDLEAAVHEQKMQLVNLPLAELLNEQIPLQPIVARRYGIETGNLRLFKPVFIDKYNLNKITLVNEPTIYIILLDIEEIEDAFIQEHQSFKNSLALTAIIGSGSLIRQSLLEVVALQRVYRNNPELASDPVGQRELKDRLNSAVRAEKIAIASILDDPIGSTWFWNSRKYKLLNKRAFQELLTKILVENYSKAPHLHNEMINRDKPSSTAMAGRKKLLLAMLNKANEENLGIEKFPSEKAMYRSLLYATGLHTKSSNGWQFSPPNFKLSPTNKNIEPLWLAIEDFLDRTEQTPISIAQFYKELTLPPYGLKSGLLPIIFLVAFLAYKEEIILFEDNNYSPFLTQEILEKILRFPASFSMQRYKVNLLREELFKNYTQAITLDESSSSNLLGVAKALARFMINLSDYAKRTKKVSDKAQKVREHFFSAKSPARLLFHDLPVSCGYDPITSTTTDEYLDKYTKDIKSIFKELRAADDSLNNAIKLHLINTFRINEKTSLSELREKLRGRFGSLHAYTIDTHGLKAFIGRIADTFGDDGYWLNSVATFIARKPPEKWFDDDIQAFKYRLVEFSKQLRDLEILRTHNEAHSIESNTDFEVVMLRTIRQGGKDLHQIVALDDTMKKATFEKLHLFKNLLDDLNSEDLRLAVLAQLFEEYITSNKNLESESQIIDTRELNER